MKKAKLMVLESPISAGQRKGVPMRGFINIVMASVFMLGSVVTFAEDSGERKFYTTAGALEEYQVGNVLAHDHMFVEFGPADPVAYLDAKRKEVYKVIGPLVEEAKDLGYNVFVDPTPTGVGRRADIVKYVAHKTKMPTMMVTGIYHEPNIQDWVYDATVEEISAWLQKELNQGIANTGVRAGFIKLSQSWGGTTPTELKVLEAACDAAKKTNASIGSHILQGFVALNVIDSLEGFGCDASRFIWIHAPYTAFWESSAPLLEAAARGAFISHDFIGSKFWGAWLDGDNDDETQLALLQEMIAAGYEDQIIIGQDSGWFDPQYGESGELEGVFEIQGFNHIAEVFVDKMKADGISDEVIHKLLHSNPWNAYSR
jgi:phosphotriesterase-related protein